MSHIMDGLLIRVWLGEHIDQRRYKRSLVGQIRLSTSENRRTKRRQQVCL